ncbi:MAG: monovalent cation/H+ antiporter complex subunit F [Microbacterium sp.]
MVQTILLIAIGACFLASAVLAIIRMVRGPSILDRTVASDVLLTLVVCALGCEAVVHHSTRSLPVMVVIAAVGVFGTIAVARFVARKDRER